MKSCPPERTVALQSFCAPTAKFPSITEPSERNEPAVFAADPPPLPALFSEIVDQRRSTTESLENQLADRLRRCRRRARPRSLAGRALHDDSALPARSPLRQCRQSFVRQRAIRSILNGSEKRSASTPPPLVAGEVVVDRRVDDLLSLEDLRPPLSIRNRGVALDGRADDTWRPWLAKARRRPPPYVFIPSWNRLAARD